MPESRQKYLYERLGDHDFQLLVNALLTERFPDYLPMPLRQADGGRDGIRRAGQRLLIYQTKWSIHGRQKDPVAWLTRTVKSEEVNIRACVADGATKYVLATNVASTGKPGRGTFDRLQAELDALGKEYGIEMACFWRETIDGMVDSAPDSIKWAYADMLAGWDLIRYLIDEQVQSRRDRGLRELVRKVAAAQWDDDEKVKFSQGLVPSPGGAMERNLIQAVLDGQCPGVTSIRSLPAQLAVALSPNAFHTTSTTGFNGLSEGEARRRQDAIAALKRDGSPYGRIATERRFKAGEKGSTFPWSNTASALFSQTGRCWLASEMGAALVE